MTPPWMDMVIGIIAATIGSSGLWAFVMKRQEKNSNTNKLLLGLAHDRIIYLCEKYCERGWITYDEYENLHDYLYVPYHESGGNGAAETAMNEVKKLEKRSVQQLVNGGIKL